MFSVMEEELELEAKHELHVDDHLYLTLPEVPNVLQRRVTEEAAR